MSGFVIICIVVTIAIWFGANRHGDNLARTPTTEFPSRTQTEQLQPGAMKATLPRDLINRLDKGTR